VSPFRAALYHRVSTIEQSSDAAREELRAYVVRCGFSVVLDVEETGSGANNNRPGLLKVMEASRRGKVDVVLVWKLDRFGRSALDLLANLRELDGAGVRFIATTQGIDIRPGGDAMSRLMLTMLGGVAEFERELIVERTRLGLAKARRDGKQLGRPKVERPSHKEVARLRDKGGTWATIAGELGCSQWAARQAVKNGGQNEPANSL